MPFLKALIGLCIFTLAAAGSWHQMAKNVCVGTRDGRFKEIVYPWKSPAFIAIMKLVHVQGKIGCKSQHYSNWGCGTKSPYINMVVTDLNNQIIYPSQRFVKMGPGEWYKLPGYTSSSHNLIFIDFGYPKYMQSGGKWRIWYGEDLFDYTEGDNSGQTCFDVHVYMMSG